MIAALVLSLCSLLPQGAEGRPAGTLGPPFDPATGWPVVQEPAPWPAKEVLPVAAAAPSGTAPGSPLLEVFRATRSPAAFQALGGLTACWRVSLQGEEGEPLGVLEFVHKADPTRPDRDRIERADGRAHGRDGALVFASRQGMPWPTAAPAAADELALFGLLLRAPWVFADPERYVVLGSERKDGLLSIHLEERLPGSSVGPDPAPAPRDRFELRCEPATGEPVELRYALARSAGERRLLLQDWREVDSVRLPFRRVLLDAAGRPSAVLELLRLQTGAPHEPRTFRP